MALGIAIATFLPLQSQNRSYSIDKGNVNKPSINMFDACV